MSCLDHFPVDPVQDLRGKQPQVVLDRLQGILGGIVPTAVTQHLANGVVLVGQFVKPVVIGIQPEPENAQNENPPLFHARSATVGGGLLCALLGRQMLAATVGNHLLQNFENPLAKVGRGVNVLQHLQDRGDVGPGLGVELDVGDIDLTDAHLGIAHEPHEFRSTKICQ